MPSLEKLAYCLTLRPHCNDPGMKDWMSENCAVVCATKDVEAPSNEKTGRVTNFIFKIVAMI